MKKINNILPNLFLYETYTFALDDLTKEFKIENPIKYIYGVVRCNWAFNYNSFIKFQDKSYVENLLGYYKEKNIIPIINFSKNNISIEDLNDDFSNFLLDKCYENNGEVIVSSDILFDYIKNKYSDIKVTSSIYKPMLELKHSSYDEELEFYNSLSNKFDKVTIRPEFNKNLNNDIGLNKEKMIIIVNNSCLNNCSFLEACLNTSTTEINCSKFKKNYALECYENIEMLSQEQINNLINIGYTNFMILDNKQSIKNIYTLFNTLLFNNQDYFTILSNELSKKIHSYLLNDSKQKTFLGIQNLIFFRKTMGFHLDIANI